MSAIEIRVGSQLWLDGRVWAVEELSGREATLRAGVEVRTVSVSVLVSHARKPSALMGFRNGEG